MENPALKCPTTAALTVAVAVAVAVAVVYTHPRTMRTRLTWTATASNSSHIQTSHHRHNTSRLTLHMSRPHSRRRRLVHVRTLRNGLRLAACCNQIRRRRRRMRPQTNCEPSGRDLELLSIWFSIKAVRRRSRCGQFTVWAADASCCVACRLQ